MSLRYRLRGQSVQVLEMAPPWVQTDLMGAATNRAPCRSTTFIEETMEKFASASDEVLVDRVRMLRDNPGPDEWAFVEKFNDNGELKKRRNRRAKTVRLTASSCLAH